MLACCDVVVAGAAPPSVAPASSRCSPCARRRARVLGAPDQRCRRCREFSAAVRSVNGQPDFELRAQRDGFDEALYERVAKHPQVALAQPGDRDRHLCLRRRAASACRCACSASTRWRGAARAGADAASRAGAQRLALLDPEHIFLNAAARQRLGVAIDAACAERVVASVELRVRGSVAAGGPPLAVMDIAGAQAHFGWLGRLEPHRRAARAGRRPRAGAARARAARRRARRVARRSGAARLEPVARLPRQPHGAGAGGAVHRRLPRVLGAGAVGRASARRSSRCSACSGLSARERLRWCWPNRRCSAPLGSVLGLALGTALAALGAATARRRSRRRLLPRRGADAAVQLARGARVRRARRRSRRSPAAGCRRASRSASRRRRRSKGWATTARRGRTAGSAPCCWRSVCALALLPPVAGAAARRLRSRWRACCSAASPACRSASAPLLSASRPRDACACRCWRSSARATSATPRRSRWPAWSRA